MILLLDRLKNTKNMSASESKIALFILDNLETVSQLTIYELAKLTYTSPATITRLCRKLKTEGFTDLKVKLAKEVNVLGISNERIESNVPFTKDESTVEIMKKIFDLNIQSLQDTYNNLDIEVLERIAHLIDDAPSTFMYGAGQSLIQSLDFQYKMFRIKKNVEVEANNGFLYMKSNTQPKDSIAIMISYHGKTSHNLEIIKNLQANGIFTILITGPNTNPLCMYANEVIHVPPQEELIRKMASFSSRTATQLVLDMIYSIIFSLHYEDYEDFIGDNYPKMGNEDK